MAPPTRDLTKYFSTPRDAVAYIMDTFPIVKRKDWEKFGTYRTKDRILNIYDALAESQRTGRPFVSPLNPPPGPPTTNTATSSPCRNGTPTIGPLISTFRERGEYESAGLGRGVILTVRRAIPSPTKMRIYRRTAAQPRNTVEVLVSGGIDSAALLAFYTRQHFRVRALFVDFGQPAAKQEARATRAVCKHYGVQLSTVTVKCAAAFSPGEISGRNAFLVFAAMLARGAKPGIIAIGIHEGTPYYDCTEGFLKSIQTVVDGYAAGKIKVAAPFLNWGKQIIWEFCKKVGVPVNSTYSCEKGGVHPCGKCLSCKDREALSVL